MPNQGLSHGETWDDSELVDSWNEALEEYKKYHSIAAKGENIDELVKQFNEGRFEPSQSFNSVTQPPAVSEDEGEYVPDAEIPPAKPQDPVLQDERTGAVQSDRLGSSGIPQVLLSSVRDESMRNLMMSWYYAGYYTGFLEGQQEANAKIKSTG